MTKISPIAFLKSHPDYTRMMSARVISVMGSQFSVVTNMLLVQKMTNSALAVGWCFIADTIPRIIFSMIGGVAVDRTDRKKIMIICDLLRAFVILGFVSLAAIGQMRLIFIIGFSAISGTAAAFYMTATKSVLPDLLETENLQQGNALGQMCIRFSSILGSSLGGVVFTMVGPWLGYGIDSISFFLSALLISGHVLKWVPAKQTEQGANKEKVKLWQDIREGWVFIFSQNVLIALVGIAVASPFVTLALPQLLPKFAETNLSTANPALFGILWSGMSIGMTVGAIFLNFVERLRHKGLLILLSLMLLGVGSALIGLSHNFFVVLSTIIFMGICMSWSDVLLVTVYQTIIPREILGRFLGNVGLFELAMQPVVIYLVGVTADRYGAGNLLATLGVGVTVFTLIWFVCFIPIFISHEKLEIALTMPSKGTPSPLGEKKQAA